MRGIMACIVLPIALAGALSAQPFLLHSRTYDSGLDDYAPRRCVAMDVSTVYAAGIVYDGNERDLALWAQTLSGTTLWIRTIGGVGDQTPCGLALDGTGGVYVAGTGDGFGSSSDIFLAHYDSSGNQNWIRSYDRGNSDIAHAIAVDSSGNIGVTGSSVLGAKEAVMVSWDSTGTFRWASFYDIGVFEEGRNVCFDSSDNAYVAGASRPSISSQDRCFTACYDSSGNEVWSDEFGSSGITSATGVLVDSGGNCFVSLTQRTAVASPQRAVVLKYDAAGALQWSAPYSVGDPAGGDRGEAMVLNAAGGVFQIVESFSGTDWDVHLLSVNSAMPQALAVFDSGVSDEVSDAFVDNAGNIMVCGLNIGATGGDGLFIAFNPAGWVDWVATFGAGSTESFYAIAENAAGQIALYGERQNMNDSDMIVVRFRENTPPAAIPATVTGYEDLALTITPSGADAESDPLTFQAVTQPAAGTVVSMGGGTQFLFTPAPGFIGQVSFLFEAYDGAATSAAATIAIDVIARNDAPAFSIPQQVIVPVGVTSPHQFPVFATGISAGPPDEAAQVLQFLVTGNTNTALFTQSPQLDAGTGQLSFQTTGVEGYSLITVVLKDDGGTANGGSDTSQPRSFYIYVGDPPKEGSEENDEGCSTAERPGWLVALPLLLLAILCSRRSRETR